jgi:hypothetical protein
VSASFETWEDYAGRLLGWLRLVRLIDVVDDVVRLPKDDRALIAKQIGNLRQKFRARGQRRYFLPGAFWSHVESVFARLPATEADLTVKQRDALRDLKELGICNEEGTPAVESISELKAAVVARLSEAPYERFWTAAAEGAGLEQMLVEEFGLKGLEPGTVQWRLKLLVNWGHELEKLPMRHHRRLRVSESAALKLPLFDLG